MNIAVEMKCERNSRFIAILMSRINEDSLSILRKCVLSDYLIHNFSHVCACMCTTRVKKSKLTCSIGHSICAFRVMVMVSTID